MSAFASDIARSMLGLGAKASDVRILAQDIVDVATEIRRTERPAAAELVRRIGGIENLPGYVATLRAGAYHVTGDK